MTTVTLTAAPSLPPLLARGALLSPLKRPGPGAEAPATRLVLPAARADRTRLAAYREVCGFAPDQAALPVTYPHVLGFPLAMRIMAERRFPLPLLGLVHTSITVTQGHDLPVDEAYELSVYVKELAPHRRGTEATVVTELRAGDTRAWTSTSTYLARHRTDTPAAAAAEERPEPLPAVAEWKLPGDLGRRYGAASGDRNPIHLHPLTARLFGFPRAIAHGMWTVARCLAEHGAEGEVQVRAAFKAPVLLPATVTYASRGPAFELRSARTHVTGEVLRAGGG
ncbi:MaoC/PaaZ C-terminal domain-containing protein [Streptomyces sp. NBC_01474]|uniref:MaoC family dehydratase n=1 Tax=unclassified Streptomyces TaxID=2593676 RepID=UPI002DDC5F17|nr:MULTISPECIES: MaoC/PaaZ C-terminal domain-containing protein [unclassified Streptomyces]WSD96807.1 MaoC/PaaZ C-terminal domain-containing protein [Streptomyces sp. NBC_01474]